LSSWGCTSTTRASVSTRAPTPRASPRATPRAPASAADADARRTSPARSRPARASRMTPPMRPLRALALAALFTSQTLPMAVLTAALMGPVAPDAARRIVDQGIGHSEVMAFEDAMCHAYGSRLTGSLAFERAAAWARQQFAAMGLDARLEPWGEWQCGWDREQWQGRVVSAAPVELQGARAGGDGRTRGPAGGTAG